MAEIAGDISTERPYSIEVTWKLRDFLRIPADVDSLILSPSVSLAEADWRLELYPNGQSLKDSEGYIDIYLQRESSSVAQQRVKATFSLENSRGKNCESCSINDVYERNDSCGIKAYIARSRLQKARRSLLPDGTLTVHCEIMVKPSLHDSGTSEKESSETDSAVERIETEASPRPHLDASSQTEMTDAYEGGGDLRSTSESIHNLQSNYKKLLDSEEDSDVCLKVSDKEFRAHKCILRARSSVFSAMFEHDTLEKNSGEVVIEDLDPESFPDFLQHVYAGSVNTLSEENVFSLYTAADKYDMADLKSQCKSYMQRTLSVDTFCDVMIVALLYKEDELLKAAVNFFSKNLTRIIVTVKWQRFLKEYDTAANELFIKAFVPPNAE